MFYEIVTIVDAFSIGFDGHETMSVALCGVSVCRQDL